MKRKIRSSDLVTVTIPQSLKNMNLVGIVISQHGGFLDVYMPDISRSIAFEEFQLEKIDERKIQGWRSNPD